MIISIIQGDCREVLAGLEADSFHACVTDPPYGIGFMSRSWDRTGVAFRSETWEAVYRVLKPGAHLLAFGGTRTFHRLVCAIEDAGFEIRDTIMWIYGSGFPKSLDVGKAIDRAAGAEREVVGRYQPPNGTVWNLENDISRSDIGAIGHSDRVASLAITAPATEAAREWQGWGTSLKPACEMVCVARKPLSEGTVAANVLRHGTGAINVDASRVGETRGVPASHSKTFNRIYGALAPAGRDPNELNPNVGRWPANVCHDGSPEVMDAFAKFGERTSGNGDRRSNRRELYGEYNGDDLPREFNGDAGTAARFFFCAKADASERVGHHPTVKPVALMEWLVRLVTPPLGKVLDPFAGTGSTLVACDRLGFDAVGIEQDAQTVADAHEKLRRMRARRAIGDAERVKPVEGQLRLF